MAVCLRCGLSFSPDAEFCGLDGQPLVKQHEDPMIGRTVDRYRIIGVLGAGAMARVYRARHVFLEAEFAVKILLGEYASNQTLAERFRREALAASKIKHPNIVGIIDFGVTPEGLTFAVMELINGVSLSQRLAEVGPLPAGRAAELALDIVSGLSAAHELGFVHRDLKPGNVMLAQVEPRELAKVVDFGLVRLEDQGDDVARLTKTGQLFGTPLYMAPEQVSGGDVGPGADIYALGTILYELLSGKPPFSGGLHVILSKQLTELPPPIDDFFGLGPLALSMLDKEPTRRPSTAAVKMRLESILADRMDTRDGPKSVRRGTPGRGTESSPFLDPSTTIASGQAPGEEGPSALPAPRASAGRGVGWLIALAASILVGAVASAAYIVLAPDKTPRRSEVTIEALPPPPKSDAKKREDEPKEKKVARAERKSRPKGQGGFDDLDEDLGQDLGKKGLLLQDLEGKQPDAARRWRAWRGGKGKPTQAQLRTTYERLDNAAQRIDVDRGLLSKKLDRVDAALKDARQRGIDVTQLELRAFALRRDAKARGSRTAMETLAFQISALELDAYRVR